MILCGCDVSLYMSDFCGCYVSLYMSDFCGWVWLVGAGVLWPCNIWRFAMEDVRLLRLRIEAIRLNRLYGEKCWSVERGASGVWFLVYGSG